MRGVRWPDGRPFLLFKRVISRSVRMCPRGRGECMVPLFPQAYSHGATWHWDGNRDAPTLTPSINCLAEKAGQILAGRLWPARFCARRRVYRCLTRNGSGFRRGG